MNVWEFRRFVRERRFLLCKGACPLGVAMAGRALNPTPTWAQLCLGIPFGYALGVVGGFDASTPQTDLPGSEVFDRGERYGKRMRLVAAHLRVLWRRN